jgi:signal transduction histidine kinase
MRSISFKLILAFLAIGIVSVAVIGLVTRWTTRAEFFRFVSERNQSDIVTDLTDFYQETGSWSGVEVVFAQNGERITQSTPPNYGPPHSPPFVLSNETGVVLVAGGGYNVGDQIPASELAGGTPIQANGKTAGILVPIHSPFEGGPREQEFIQRTNLTFLYSALGAALIALLLGIFLSRSITRPLRELTRATHAITEGDFEQQVSIRSRDELGELAKAFNKMSTELARSVNARRQMTADIAHELRTPLSLILGHAEAVHDGVLPPSPENFEIIRDEAIRLEHLVDDLRTLSLADAGELTITPQAVSPERLLQEMSTRYRFQAQTKNIALDLDIASPLSDLEVDPGRLTQVLTNILDNALRHTPAGGHIVLAARQTGDTIELSIRDSGPGLPPDELDRIFDRFYRADASRHRADGGSGLGLAIAKSIIQAHGGQIRAESEQGNGLAVIITLPVKE